MSAIVKPKRFLVLLMGFILLPLIIPPISNTIDFIYNSGVKIGTELRYLISNHKC